MKKLLGVALVAAHATSTYFGLWEGVEGALRLALGMTWFVFTLSLFFFSDEVVIDAAKNPPLIPTALSVLLDLLIVASFWWHGWWTTGAALTFAMVMEARVWAVRSELAARG